MDKRVLRTRESIKTALMQLAIENEVKKITVCDIAEKAKINRSTFYLHYNDVSAVIADIDKEFADSIAAGIDNFNILDVYGSIYDIFSTLSNQLDSDETRKKYIIFSSNTSEITAKLKNNFTEKAVNAISNYFPSLDPNKIVYPVTFASAGIVDCYIKWCRSKDEGTPLNEIIREVSVITDHIVNSITGGGDF